MHECVYTNQKNKKIKKWTDGFINIENKKLKLFTEDKKCIYSCTEFSIQDDSIETPFYLINCSEYELLENAQEDKEEPSAEETHNKKIYSKNFATPFKKLKNNSSLLVEEFEYKIDPIKEEKILKIDGRSNDEILKLWEK